MSLASVIDSFKTGDYTLKRPGAVSYVNGLAVAGATSSSTIAAVVTPLTGRELLRLPEGDRDKERLLVLSRSEMRTTGVGGKADLITINGEDYEVSSVEPWPMFGFHKAVVTRVDR